MDPSNYWVSFLKGYRLLEFPVEECKGRATSLTNLRIHFLNRHLRDTVVIHDEGNRPHPRYPYCEMFVPWEDLNWSHPETTWCAKGDEKKRYYLAAEEAQAGEKTSFQAYGWPLPNTESFEYLDRLLTETDSNWMAVFDNLSKS